MLEKAKEQSEDASERHLSYDYISERGCLRCMLGVCGWVGVGVGACMLGHGWGMCWGVRAVCVGACVRCSALLSGYLG
eukprot:01806.XXX_3199_4700_1 [CDS] Oithona nana genome sequencing.